MSKCTKKFGLKSLFCEILRPQRVLRIVVAAFATTTNYSLMLVMMALLLIAACSKSVPDSPQETYVAFYQAIVDNDFIKATEYLSPECLEIFHNLGQQLMVPSGQANPLNYFLHEIVAFPLQPLQDVKVLSRESDRVVLEVTAGKCESSSQKSAVGKECSFSQIVVKKISGRWLLFPELPEVLVGNSYLKTRS